jgi:hypothetical protein
MTIGEHRLENVVMQVTKVVISCLGDNTSASLCLTGSGKRRTEMNCVKMTPA